MAQKVSLCACFVFQNIVVHFVNNEQIREGVLD